MISDNVNNENVSQTPVPKPRTIWTEDRPEPMPRALNGNSTLKLYQSLKKQVNEGIDETRKNLRKLTKNLSTSVSSIDKSDELKPASFYIEVFNNNFNDFFDALSFCSPLNDNDQDSKNTTTTTYDSPRSVLSTDEYEEVLRRKSTVTSNSWLFYDSIYANTSKNEPNISEIRQVTKSTIFEFDPLLNNQEIDESVIEKEDIKCLENLLKQGLNFDSFQIPELPKRVESLNLHLDITNSDEPLPETKKKNWFQNILRKNSETDTVISNSNEIFVQPTLNSVTLVHHKGLLFKYNTGKELFQKYSPYWCVLTNSKFTCYANMTCENIKKSFVMTSIGSVTKGPIEKHNDGEIYMFQINLPDCFRKRFVFGTSTVSRRRLWMQKFAEAFTIEFPLKFLVNYTKIGWANTKNVINGAWSSTWLLLTNRLLLHQTSKEKFEIIDLRQVRVINLQTELKSAIFIDFQIGTIYFTMCSEYETKDWFQLISKSSCDNGANIDEQQLTKNNIPVIVEKCLNFIYANGLMSEGIYRRSGPETVVNDLLEKFRNNAWDVTLTPIKHTEHDVACVLKRFLRELPEPLLSTIDLLSFNEEVQKNDRKTIVFLQQILDKLPVVSLKTLKIIICHLNTVQRQSHKNLMTIENLASIWGPTLIRFDKKGCDLREINRISDLEISIMHVLIKNYEKIFLISKEELEHEQKIFESLENYWKHSTNDLSQNSIKIWIYNIAKWMPVSIQINYNTNVLSACAELKRMIVNNRNISDELILEESIYDGKLTRLLFKYEKLFDVITGWNDYFDEKIRKTNCLIVSEINSNFRYKKYLREDPIDPKYPTVIEIMLSLKNNKKFKKYQLQLNKSHLQCIREKNEFYEWDFRSTKVYLGSLHNIPNDSHWFITLVGRVITNSSKKDRFLSNSQCIWFTHEDQYKLFLNTLFQFYFFEEF